MFYKKMNSRQSHILRVLSSIALGQWRFAWHCQRCLFWGVPYLACSGESRKMVSVSRVRSFIFGFCFGGVDGWELCGEKVLSLHR